MTYTNHEAFEYAKTYIPGGVNSPVRAFGGVGGDPVFIDRAQGARITDVTGTSYLDLVGSWGPALLGHAHPDVVAAVVAAAAKGLSFGAPTVAEAQLAQLISERIAPVEQVRLVSTGTEATMTALRLARGFTSRPLIVKFAGCYHGHSDGLLAQAGSGLATHSLPTSAGVTEEVAGQTIVLPYNNLPALEQVFASQGEQIAAVITEGAPANMGIVPPASGFNRKLRELTTKYGAVLIFDEVLTGFRASYRGWWGLEEDIQEKPFTPDLFTFGKVIGGGMPLAALGGRREILDYLAPLGPVYQAGTLSGNPVAVAAGLETLKLATPELYDDLLQTSQTLGQALQEALTTASLPGRVQYAGTLFSVFFGQSMAEHSAKNYADVQASDTFRYPAFFHAMLEQKVVLPPSNFEAWFVSSAHDASVVDQIISAFPKAVAAAKAVAAR